MKSVIFKSQFYYNQSDNIDAVFLIQHKYGNSVAIFMMFCIKTDHLDAVFLRFSLLHQKCKVFTAAAEMLSFTRNISAVCHFHNCIKSDNFHVTIFIVFIIET